MTEWSGREYFVYGFLKGWMLFVFVASLLFVGTLT